MFLYACYILESPGEIIVKKKKNKKKQQVSIRLTELDWLELGQGTPKL